MCFFDFRQVFPDVLKLIYKWLALLYSLWGELKKKVLSAMSNVYSGETGNDQLKVWRAFYQPKN